MEIDVASEFRYREAPLEPAVWRYSCRNRERPPTRWPRCDTPAREKQHIVSVVNVPTSTMARESHMVPRRTRVEIGVASTKAFTCQLSVLLCLAIAAGRARGTERYRRRRNLCDALIGFLA